METTVCLAMIETFCHWSTDQMRADLGRNPYSMTFNDPPSSYILWVNVTWYTVKSENEKIVSRQILYKWTVGSCVNVCCCVLCWRMFIFIIFLDAAAKFALILWCELESRTLGYEALWHFEYIKFYYDKKTVKIGLLFLLITAQEIRFKPFVNIVNAPQYFLHDYSQVLIRVALCVVLADMFSRLDFNIYAYIPFCDIRKDTP